MVTALPGIATLGKINIVCVMGTKQFGMNSMGEKQMHSVFYSFDGQFGHLCFPSIKAFNFFHQIGLMGSHINGRRRHFCTVAGSVKWMESTWKIKWSQKFHVSRCVHKSSVLTSMLEYGLGSASTMCQSNRFLSQDCLEHGHPKSEGDVLGKAIAFEAQHGFINIQGRTARFSDFLSMKLLLLLRNTVSSQCSKLYESLMKGARSYDTLSLDDRRDLLEKVTQFLGQSSIRDMIDHYISLDEAHQDLHLGLNDLQHTISSVNMEKEKRNGRKSPSTKRCVDLSRESVRTSSLPLLAQTTATWPSFEAQNEKTDREISDCIGSEIQMKKGALLPPRYSNSQKNLEANPFCGKENVRHSLIEPISGFPYESWLLNKPITAVSSLEVSQRQQLEKNGFHTLRKLLQHFPRTYLNFQQAGIMIQDGQYLTFSGKIITSRGVKVGPSLALLEVVLESTLYHDCSQENLSLRENRKHEKRRRTVYLHAKRFFSGVRFTSCWFLNKVAENYPLGIHATVSGKVKACEEINHFEVKDFIIQLSEKGNSVTSNAGPCPVYASRNDLESNTINGLVKRVLADLPLKIDPLPEHIREKFKLMELHSAYTQIHAPSDLEMAEKARQRFVFEDFFYQQLGFLMQRLQAENVYLKGEATLQLENKVLGINNWSPMTQKFIQALSFKLTESQIKVASEIMWDLRRQIPMRRLLQGDVGCGKTIVAFLCLLEVTASGYQGALMVPSVFLANQHYEKFLSWIQELDEQERPQIALLTSSIPKKKARAIRKGVKSGDTSIVVGTHSLISDSVEFAALRLAIIDEQHRFGVCQRLRLSNKGLAPISGMGSHDPSAAQEKEEKSLNIGEPHVLAMSATPIPRTLALALYGDMALSKITELPMGRLPIDTYVFRNNKANMHKVYRMVHKELQGGGRIIIICPCINKTDNFPDLKAATVEYEALVEEFKDYKCGLAHGQMDPQEKEEAMKAFMVGTTQVLVSTTVIEVGIDIPDASMIVVMNAERFGLAQLHQLRGRVGRGSRKSTCVLLGSSAHSLERLRLLQKSKDGFYLADADLRMRGAGNLLGERQSGHLPDFSIARLEEDGDVMNQARAAAEEIVQGYPGLEGLPTLKQELSFRQNPNVLVT